MQEPLAGTSYQVVGMQSDGSLWRIYSTTRKDPSASLSSVPQPERIGTDSDWKTVIGGGHHFLALKTDGTLWGWGNNGNGQLGTEPEQINSSPVRIGGDADWISVFASGNISTGVKRDGSVWKWGWLNYYPDGQETKSQARHSEPLRWNADGTNWLAFESRWHNCDLVVERNGTLWAMGFIPSNLLGYDLYREDYRGDYHRVFIAKPMRVGSDSDWSDIRTMGGDLLAIKKNGAMVQSPIWDFHLAFWGRVWKPSKYSDWIAIANAEYFSYVTLAADGTLCSWGDPLQQARESVDRRDGASRRLLGSSRKPLWSANIFREAKERDSTTPGQP